MENINKYDERQLKLMSDSLLCFENHLIDLNSLIGTLEFLLSAMESVDMVWEEKFLKEITVLESINAIDIINKSGEELNEINFNKKNDLINIAVINLKALIEKKLSN